MEELKTLLIANRGEIAVREDASRCKQPRTVLLSISTG